MRSLLGGVLLAGLLTGESLKSQASLTSDVRERILEWCQCFLEIMD